MASPTTAAPSNEEQTKQDAERRSEKLLANKLVEEWSFEDSDLAHRFARNGIAKVLLKLEKDRFKCSEFDPLLIISVDLNDVDSIGYFNEGNYGIAPTTSGHLAGPNVGQQGPNAVGAFLNNYPGVQDKSGGDLTVLYFDSFGTVFNVRDDFSQQQQFTRVGPLVAARLGMPQAEASLVQFFTLDRMRSQPSQFRYFNIT
jgi:hypothetical protein